MVEGEIGEGVRLRGEEAVQMRLSVVVLLHNRERRRREFYKNWNYNYTKRQLEQTENFSSFSDTPLPPQQEKRHNGIHTHQSQSRGTNLE